MSDHTDLLSSIQYVALDEITPRATARYAIINGIQYLSIRDFIMHICDKDQHDAARIWRQMTLDKISELGQYLSNFQFHGRGQSIQPVITFAGAMKLMMFLPGEKAKRNRSVMARILVGYFSGDPALVREIEANAELNTPLTKMAKDAVLENGTIPVEVGQCVEDSEVTLMKRKREELDIMKMETEIKLGSVKAVTSAVNAYTEICDNEGLDEIAKTVFKNEMLRSIQIQISGRKIH